MEILPTFIQILQFILLIGAWRLRFKRNRTTKSEDPLLKFCLGPPEQIPSAAALNPLDLKQLDVRVVPDWGIHVAMETSVGQKKKKRSGDQSDKVVFALTEGQTHTVYGVCFAEIATVTAE